MKKPIVGKLIAFTIDNEKKIDMLIEYQELAEVIHSMKAQGARLEGCFFLNNEIKMKITPPNLLDKVFKLVFTPMNYEEYRQAEFEEAVRYIDRTYKPFISREEGGMARRGQLNELHDAVSLPTPEINLTERSEEMIKQQKESNIEAWFEITDPKDLSKVKTKPHINWSDFETPKQTAARLFVERNKRG